VIEYLRDDEALEFVEFNLSAVETPSTWETMVSFLEKNFNAVCLTVKRMRSSAIF